MPYTDPQLVHTLQVILEFLGTFAFAISGIRHAAQKHFDWFGGYVCGFAVGTVPLHHPDLQAAGTAGGTLLPSAAVGRAEEDGKDKCDKKGGSPRNFCLKSSSPTGKSCFLSEHKTSSQVRMSLYSLYKILVGNIGHPVIQQVTTIPNDKQGT